MAREAICVAAARRLSQGQVLAFGAGVPATALEMRHCPSKVPAPTPATSSRLLSVADMRAPWMTSADE
jgi:hypothetical protein